MKIEENRLHLQPICAWDQIRFQSSAGGLLAQLSAFLPSAEEAQAVAENCVLIYCATRGQLEGVETPGDLLYALDLEDLAALAEEYSALVGPQEEGVNESFPMDSALS